MRHNWRQILSSQELSDKQLESLSDVLDIQGSDGNWNYKGDPNYMTGMYNGMELMDSIVDNRDPKFKDVPKKASLKLSWEVQPDFLDAIQDFENYLKSADPSCLSLLSLLLQGISLTEVDANHLKILMQDAKWRHVAEYAVDNNNNMLQQYTELLQLLEKYVSKKASLKLSWEVEQGYTGNPNRYSIEALKDELKSPGISVKTFEDLVEYFTQHNILVDDKILSVLELYSGEQRFSGYVLYYNPLYNSTDVFLEVKPLFLANQRDVLVTGSPLRIY